jgi:hypothetical protein
MGHEHYIPLSKRVLIAHLLERSELSAAEREQLARLFAGVSLAIHAQFHHRLEVLKELYAPFDPDRPPSQVVGIERQTSAHLREFFDGFDELATRANFRVLTLADLHAALSDRTHWGLNLEIDIDAFDRLELYARGNISTTRSQRRWQNWFREEMVEVLLYERLIILFRLAGKRRFRRYRGEEHVFLKLFKEIPRLDIDMLLPGTSVKMSLIDRIKILVPTVSGLGIAIWKILQGAVMAAFAGIYGLLTLLGLVGGTIGYGMRSFYGYLNTKNRYQLNLTESLYYQNLDNNAGVFFRLLDEAEEQENCEAALGYYFLRRFPQGCTSAELDHAVEEYLPTLADKFVDFEVCDSLAKLLRLGLATEESDKYSAIDLAAAIEKFPVPVAATTAAPDPFRS